MLNHRGAFRALVYDKQFMTIPLRFLSIICFIVFTLNVNLSLAQIRLGPKVGFNFSELPDNTIFIIGNQHIYNGYHLGVIAEYKVFKQLFLQPGVLVTSKGSKYIVGNETVGSATGFSNFQFSGLYVDFPLNLMYKIDLGLFKLFLIAGPDLGYGLTGKWKGSDGTSSNVHFGNGSDDDFKPFDYGLSFGGGVEAGRIQLSAQYYQGLRALSTSTPPLKEQKYRGLNISIAWLFGNDERVYRDYESRYLRKHRQNKRHWK
jgi:hypothetical protein